MKRLEVKGFLRVRYGQVDQRGPRSETPPFSGDLDPNRDPVNRTREVKE